MSGGHFEYKHHYIQDIIDSIQKEIDCNKTPNEEWYCNNFNADTIQTFKEALYHLNNAYNYAHAIDYLLFKKKNNMSATIKNHVTWDDLVRGINFLKNHKIKTPMSAKNYMPYIEDAIWQQIKKKEETVTITLSKSDH